MAKNSTLTVKEVIRALGSLLVAGLLVLATVAIATCAVMGGIKIGIKLFS